MKSREDAAMFVNRQLEGPNTAKHDGVGLMYETVLFARSKWIHWRYGKQDLRELLDFIYEGMPKNRSEQIE
jgi:hypothetical protein